MHDTTTGADKFKYLYEIIQKYNLFQFKLIFAETNLAPLMITISNRFWHYCKKTQ